MFLKKSDLLKMLFLTAIFSAFVASSGFAQQRGGNDRDRGGRDDRGPGQCRVLTSGWTNIAQVQCGRGEYALNGGGECSSERNKYAVLIHSFPLSDRSGLSTGWQADCHFTDNSAGAKAQAIVTCCPL